MYEEIRKKAQQRVQAKKGFFVVAMIFASISLILFIISISFDFRAFVIFWINFPTLILGLILAIMYVTIFGLPWQGMSAKEWEEQEMEKEMARLFRQRQFKRPNSEDLSEEDILELKELERLEKKWKYGEDDFV